MLMHVDDLPALFDRVRDEGLLMQNLFQHDDRTWQCNVRKMVGTNMSWTEFGRGATPGAAILDALSKPLVTKRFITQTAGLRTAADPQPRRSKFAGLLD